MANSQGEKGQENQSKQFYDSNSVLRTKDLEEKQNILRERLLLIGKNLIEIKEGNNEKILTIKKDIETIKHDVERIKSFLEVLSSQIEKFAKKEDLEILAKQMKMFRLFKV